jgi:hypothetical protein
MFFHKIYIFGQLSVETPTPLHPLLKVKKPWQIRWIFCQQNVLERKKLKNGKKIDQFVPVNFKSKIGHVGLFSLFT